MVEQKSEGYSPNTSYPDTAGFRGFLRFVTGLPRAYHAYRTGIEVGRQDLIQARQEARLEGALLTARMLSHEMGTPLGLAAGYAGLLKDPDDIETANRIEYAGLIEVGIIGAKAVLDRTLRIVRFVEAAPVTGGPQDITALDLEASSQPRIEN